MYILVLLCVALRFIDRFIDLLLVKFIISRHTGTSLYVILGVLLLLLFHLDQGCSMTFYEGPHFFITDARGLGKYILVTKIQ